MTTLVKSTDSATFRSTARLAKCRIGRGETLFHLQEVKRILQRQLKGFVVIHVDTHEDVVRGCFAAAARESALFVDEELDRDRIGVLKRRAGDFTVALHLMRITGEELCAALEDSRYRLVPSPRSLRSMLPPMGPGGREPTYPRLASSAIGETKSSAGATAMIPWNGLSGI
jgi:hypothetical protein